ncbi:MAG: acyl carrier protein, partial [Clostridia bacterium]|nr:acyl carrier protein [Clostridia bacterium]
MEFEKICEIIAKQLDIDPKSITMESNLVEDLHADSLDIVELVMDMEQEFDT